MEEDAAQTSPDPCAGRPGQWASSYGELILHVGHEVRVVAFERGMGILKVAMECATCNQVLIEYDNPEYEREGLP